MTSLGTCLGLFLLASVAMAAEVREVWWDELIPPGVPEFDINGLLMDPNTLSGISYDPMFYPVNDALHQQQVKMPGYVVPLTFDMSEGEAFWGSAAHITEFMLVPYVGACIHVPPPPPNQIVFVTTETPFELTELFVPVWVTGTLLTQSKSAAIAETSYTLTAQDVTLFDLSTLTTGG